MDINRCGQGIQAPMFHHTSNIQAIKEDFYSKGIAFIEGCDEKALVELASKFGTIVRPRNESTGCTGISNIRFAPSLVGKGYSSQELHFHTDRSGWDVPPRVLASTLKSKSTEGGVSMLADTVRILKEIKEQGGDLYELITNARHSSFLNDEGVLVPRPIYNEAAGLFRFRFDDSIQLSASLVVRFPQLFDIFYRNSFAVSLQQGQGYLLDNHRFLHGRTSFTGSRELLRALVNFPPPRPTINVLFDIDGTLCRSEELSVDAYYTCLTDIVGKPITHANTTVNLHGRTDLGLLHDILDHHKIQSKSYVAEKFLQAHHSYLQKSLDKGLSAATCPGVTETLEWLTIKKETLTTPAIRIGLMTGNSKPNALLKLKSAGIDTTIFDLAISSFGDAHVDRISLIEDSMAKIRARDGRDLPNSKVIVIGDTPLDVECAKRACCAVVAVASGNYGLDDLAVLEPDSAVAHIGEAKSFLQSHLVPLATANDP